MKEIQECYRDLTDAINSRDGWGSFSIAWDILQDSQKNENAQILLAINNHQLNDGMMQEISNGLEDYENLRWRIETRNGNCLFIRIFKP